MTDRRRHWEELERRLSALLRSVEGVAPVERDAVRDFIDHNEFGLALEYLVEVVVELGLSLRDDQRLEIADLAKVMQLHTHILDRDPPETV